MKKFYTTTLGCKINQYETQAIVEAWLAAGNVQVDTPQEAGLILVNSCAVTANAVADLRQTVRKLNRNSPQAQIIITGCAAQVLKEQLGELPGVTRVVPQEDKKQLLGNSVAAFAINDYPRARAVVMVQDGCSHGCTYCIVPLARGPSKSRSVEEIEAEIARLLEVGFREIILSGVNLRQFGCDLPGKPLFWDLIDSLEKRFSGWAGQARLRISSLEPGQLGERALETLSSSRLVVPQLHISLQSGDPDVLRRMGRGHYSPELLLGFLEQLKTVWPVYGLGADILVGFPGETQAMFENTLEYVHRLPLSYAHVFPYSPRPDTPAKSMSNQVDLAEKKQRAAKIRAVASDKKRAFLEKIAGFERLDVVVQDEMGCGVSQYYAPCRFTTPVAAKPRSLVPAHPVGVEGTVVLVQEIE